MEDEQEQGEQQKTPADIMREMKQEYESKLAQKDAEMAALRTKHAEEVRDILTGRDVDANKQKDFNAEVKEMAVKIRKNLGIGRK